MTVEYYLVCHDHHEFTDAVSADPDCYTVRESANQCLLPFIIAHAGCKVEIVDEHHADQVYKGFMYHKWSESEVMREIVKARRDGRWR